MNLLEFKSIWSCFNLSSTLRTVNKCDALQLLEAEVRTETEEELSGDDDDDDDDEMERGFPMQQPTTVRFKQRARTNAFSKLAKQRVLGLAISSSKFPSRLP